MTEQLTIDFKPLADALVIFHKTLVDGGIEPTHALLFTRDVLVKYEAPKLPPCRCGGDPLCSRCGRR